MKFFIKFERLSDDTNDKINPYFALHKNNILEDITIHITVIRIFNNCDVMHLIAENKRYTEN